MAAQIPGFPLIDQSTDLMAYLTQDANGRLGWSQPPHDPLPGQFWNALLAADPSLRKNVVETLAHGIRSTDKVLRLHSLQVMQHVIAAENLTALRDALASQPHAFVGVSTGTPPATLFTEWLYAVAANQLESPPETVAALQTAKSYWSLPEAETIPITSLATVAPDVAVANANALLMDADDRRIQTLLNAIDFQLFPQVAEAMQSEDLATRRRVANAMQAALQPFMNGFGADIWRAAAKALGIQPPQN